MPSCGSVGKPSETDSTEPAMRELEAKLIVVSERAAEILGQFAAETHIDRYALKARPAQTIRDRYFDTAADDLKRADLALRIRDVDGARALALKGKARRRGSAIERLEIEQPWSHTGLEAILTALRAHGVRAVGVPTEVDALCPELTLARLGLRPIQDRRTARVRRSIAARADDQVLGELALDHVIFRWRMRDIHHYEIEIESVTADDFGALERLVTELKQRYAPALRAWSHSKVATGHALERVLAIPGWRALLNANGSLREAAYDDIEVLLAA